MCFLKIFYDELKNGITEEGFEELYLYSLANYWLEDIDKKSLPENKVYTNYESVRYTLDIMQEIVANAIRLYRYDKTISYNEYIKFCTLYYGEICVTDIIELFKEHYKTITTKFAK